MRDNPAINPYTAPSGIDESTDVTVPTPVVPVTLRQRAVSAVMVIAFLSLGYIALRQFLNHQWMLSFVAASASLMCIPLVDHTHSFRERCLASLTIPFAMGGFACFVLLYFAMFQFAWFEAIFNGKGSGPLGLIVSALAGLVAGGIVGWRILKYVGIGYSDDAIDPSSITSNPAVAAEHQSDAGRPRRSRS
jgi:hypothetical protein